MLGIFPDAAAAREYSNSLDVQITPEITGWNITDRFPRQLSMRRLSIKEIQIIGSVTVLVLIGFVAVSGNFRVHSRYERPAGSVKTVPFPLDLNVSTEEELDYSLA